MFFQQAAGIHIQMLGEPVYYHIQLNLLGQFSKTAFPFLVVSKHNLHHSFQHPDPEVAFKTHSLHDRDPELVSLGLCSDTAADPADLCSPPPESSFYLFASPSVSGLLHPYTHSVHFKAISHRPLTCVVNNWDMTISFVSHYIITHYLQQLAA